MACAYFAEKLESNTPTSSPRTSRRWFLLAVFVNVCASSQRASAFVQIQHDLRPISSNGRISSTHLSMEQDDEINRGVQRARALIEKTKAKLAAQSEVPFFASKQSGTVASSREGVVNKDEKTGLITTDGEKMAKLSEQEVWENRSLFGVFDDDNDENEKSYAATSEQFASRDIAASVFNLRRQLQTSDYERIFDKRNIFIGEDT